MEKTIRQHGARSARTDEAAGGLEMLDGQIRGWMVEIADGGRRASRRDKVAKFAFARFAECVKPITRGGRKAGLQSKILRVQAEGDPGDSLVPRKTRGQVEGAICPRGKPSLRRSAN